MKFNKRISFRRLVIISIIVFSLLALIYTLYLKDNNLHLEDDFSDRLSRDFPEYCNFCQFPADVFCYRGFAFDEETNSFKVTVYGRGGDQILKEVSLVQQLPENKINCWLNTSNLPAEEQQDEHPGLLIRGTESVDIRLDCTEFSSQDVKKGVWRVEAKIYWPESGASSQEPGVGFVGINYYKCGPDKSEFCAYSFLDDIGEECVSFPTGGLE